MSRKNMIIILLNNTNTWPQLGSKRPNSHLAPISGSSSHITKSHISTSAAALCPSGHCPLEFMHTASSLLREVIARPAGPLDCGPAAAQGRRAGAARPEPTLPKHTASVVYFNELGHACLREVPCLNLGEGARSTRVVAHSLKRVEHSASVF